MLLTRLAHFSDEYHHFQREDKNRCRQEEWERMTLGAHSCRNNVSAELSVVFIGVELVENWCRANPCPGGPLFSILYRGETNSFSIPNILTT